MGNSNSQFKRSRSQYGSTRSVAFSLPSKWDQSRYSYSQPPDPSPHNTGAKPRPILRNPSRSSLPYISVYQSSTNQQNLSKSLEALHSQSLYRSDSDVRSSGKHGGGISNRANSFGELPSLSQHQFNDIYLRNDVRRLFRAQDRSNSVAQIDDDRLFGTEDSTASLDRRLFALHNQRSLKDTHTTRNPSNPISTSRTKSASTACLQGEKVKGATEKKIRSRKAKQAPQPFGFSMVPDQPKLEGMYRKKRPAPEPPSKQYKYVVDIPDSFGDNLPVYDLSVGSSQHQETLSMGPSQIETPNHEETVRPNPVPLAVSHASQTSTSCTSDMNRDTNRETPVTSALVDVEVHTEVHTAVKEPKKEYREMATQYDAPVEIAIQCNGDSLRLKKGKEEESLETPTNSSLAELLELFNKAAQAVTCSGLPEAQIEKSSCGHTSDSSDGSDKRSGVERTSGSDKTFDSDDTSDTGSSLVEAKAAGKSTPASVVETATKIPTAPPLPDFSVRLLQRRTIHDNIPITLAPTTTDFDDASSQSSVESHQNFSSFQKELLAAYKQLNKTKESNESNETDARFQLIRADSESSETSVLNAYKHSETIMGVQPRHDAESDSGHDEPSDFSSSMSHSQQSVAIPAFVLNDIAKNLPSPEVNPDSKKKEESKGDRKTKFHSIRKLKKSMRHAFSSLSRSTGSLKRQQEYLDDGDDFIGLDSNWTLTGRIKPSRQSIVDSTTFAQDPVSKTSPDVDTGTKATNQKSDQDLKQSDQKFERTNMGSFSLLLPSGYPTSSKPVSHVQPAQSARNHSPRNGLGATPSANDDSLADVML